MKYLIVLAALVITLSLTGCKDPYGACEKTAVDISSSVTSGMKTVDQLRMSGLITSAEEGRVLGYLKFVNDTNGAFSLCAQQAHQSTTKAGAYTTCAQTFQSSLENPTELALLNVANTTGAQQIQVVINGINTGVTAVITALGGK